MQKFAETKKPKADSNRTKSSKSIGLNRSQSQASTSVLSALSQVASGGNVGASELAGGGVNEIPKDCSNLATISLTIATDLNGNPNGTGNYQLLTVFHSSTSISGCRARSTECSERILRNTFLISFFSGASCDDRTVKTR